MSRLLSLQRRGVLLALLASAALAIVMTVSTLGRAEEGQETSYESTRHLVGVELARELDLKSISIAPGETVQSGDPRIASCIGDVEAANLIVRTDHGVYCTGGVAADAFQAWDLSTRLAGRVPTEAEKEAFRLDEQGDAAYEAGNLEEAVSLWSQAHDLRSQAQE